MQCITASQVQHGLRERRCQSSPNAPCRRPVTRGAKPMCRAIRARPDRAVSQPEHSARSSRAGARPGARAPSRTCAVLALHCFQAQSQPGQPAGRAGRLGRPSRPRKRPKSRVEAEAEPARHGGPGAEAGAGQTGRSRADGPGRGTDARRPSAGPGPRLHPPMREKSARERGAGGVSRGRSLWGGSGERQDREQARSAPTSPGPPRPASPTSPTAARLPSPAAGRPARGAQDRPRLRRQPPGGTVTRPGQPPGRAGPGRAASGRAGP
jgi:hypothetical protein